MEEKICGTATDGF